VRDSASETGSGVDHVTVANHHATQTLPAATKPGRVHAKLEMHWHWTPVRTVLTELVIRKFARSATITMRCAGRRCPFKVKRGDGRHLKRFVTALAHRAFHSGDRLTITVAQPSLRSERFQVTIRRNRKPAAKAL
jgi:hypothetical protein